MGVRGGWRKRETDIQNRDKHRNRDDKKRWTDTDTERDRTQTDTETEMTVMKQRGQKKMDKCRNRDERETKETDKLKQSR